jgi:hypothetical protein
MKYNDKDTSYETATFNNTSMKDLSVVLSFQIIHIW